MTSALTENAEGSLFIGGYSIYNQTFSKRIGTYLYLRPLQYCNVLLEFDEFVAVQQVYQKESPIVSLYFMLL